MKTIYQLISAIINDDRITAEKIIKSSEELQKKIDLITKENTKLKNENKKIKTDINDMSKKLNESNLKTNYLIGQLEEQNSLLTSENNDLETIRSGAASGKTAVQFNDLATVATSGSYDDLSKDQQLKTEKCIYTSVSESGTFL